MNDPTISEYLENWLHTYCEKRLKPNTVNGYRINIKNHIIPYIGKIKLSELTPDAIFEMYDTLSENGLSNTSIVYVHAVLRKAYNTAVKRLLIEKNIVLCVDPPRKERYHYRTLSPEEVRVLLETAKGSYLYLAVMFGVTLGLRRGEVLGLRWSDVDERRGTITITRSGIYRNGAMTYEDTKTFSSNRTLLLSDALLHYLIVLRNRLKPKPDDYLIVDENGKVITNAMLFHAYKQALHSAELPDIRFHDLRHTNATLLLKNNVSVKIVSSILGHSSSSVTLDVYSHVITEMQEPAAIAINKLLLG